MATQDSTTLVVIGRNGRDNVNVYTIQDDNFFAILLKSFLVVSHCLQLSPGAEIRACAQFNLFFNN